MVTLNLDFKVYLERLESLTALTAGSNSPHCRIPGQIHLPSVWGLPVISRPRGGLQGSREPSRDSPFSLQPLRPQATIHTQCFRPSLPPLQSQGKLSVLTKTFPPKFPPMQPNCEGWQWLSVIFFPSKILSLVSDIPGCVNPLQTNACLYLVPNWEEQM